LLVAVVDDGPKTLCGDAIPENVGLDGCAGTADGYDGVVVSMNEEHGIVGLAPGFTPNVGAKLAFLQSCLTTAELSDEVVVVQKGKVKNLWHAATHERWQ
jgi:D-serine deaminase-like pyridoxal phosphate-dependent protein